MDICVAGILSNTADSREEHGNGNSQNEDEAHVTRRWEAHTVWNSGQIDDARVTKIYSVKRWSKLYDKALVHVYDSMNVFTI